MSDIVERLRNWRTVHLARLHLLMKEAADEMERLSRTGTNLRQTRGNASECTDSQGKTPERDRLTDKEKDAVVLAYNQMRAIHADNVAATLRGLLGRLGGET